MDTKEKVRTVLMEVKSLTPSEVSWNDDVDIINDIGLDSLQIISFLLRLEDELNIEIDFEAFNYNHLRSLDNFCGFLEKN
jgi:acyl carrier protein